MAGVVKGDARGVDCGSCAGFQTCGIPSVGVPVTRIFLG